MIHLELDKRAAVIGPEWRASLTPPIHLGWANSKKTSHSNDSKRDKVFLGWLSRYTFLEGIRPFCRRIPFDGKNPPVCPTAPVSFGFQCVHNLVTHEGHQQRWPNGMKRSVNLVASTQHVGCTASPVADPTDSHSSAKHATFTDQAFRWRSAKLNQDNGTNEPLTYHCRTSTRLWRKLSSKHH